MPIDGNPEPWIAHAKTPYRNALSAAVGSALLSATLVATADIALTLAGATDVSLSQASLFGAVSLALYLGVGLLAGVVEGLVAGAVASTHRGARPYQRLVDDRTFDREVTGALLAFLIVAALFVAVVATLAIQLVATTERKAVGAWLAGGAAVATAIVAGLAAYPVYRVTRRIAGLVPRIGRLPRAVLCLAIMLVGAAVATSAYVVIKLDWRVLPLAVPLTALGFAVVQAAALAFVPSWRRQPVAAAAVLALVMPIVAVLGANPDERAVALLAVESRGTKTLVAVARSFFDHDNDGYSTVLGGGDCNDNDPTIHPGARDIPDDGIDQNCIGGDAHRPPEAEPAPEPPRPVNKAPTAKTPAAAGGAAAAAAAAPAAPGTLRWDGNILMIAVDTVRADRLGVAGYTRRGGQSLTPRIDELARAGTYFRRVWSQAPNTPRSFPSIFTSRFPSQIKWDGPFLSYPKVMPENLTLFEVFRQAGFRTVGEASHFYFTAERGITQGFDEFDNEGAKNIHDSNKDTAAPRIVPRAVAKLGELAKKKQRFVLFTHLFEPHSTYMEHEGFPVRARGVEGLEEKYDYEIAFVDQYIGQLLDALKTAGVADKTMVVLFSDHGEAFGKHRYGGERLFFHGQSLYDELLRVPLIFYIPGQPARTIDAPAMLVDVAPTLAALVGAPVPKSFTGRSLVPLLAGGTLPPRPVYAELLPAPDWKHESRMRIDADGKTKLLYRISDNVFELYDLSTDPDEQKNLVAEKRDVARRMKAAINSWMESEL